MLAVLDCTTVEQSVDAFVRERLPRDAARAIEEHLSHCDACQFRVDQRVVEVCFLAEPETAAAPPAGLISTPGAVPISAAPAAPLNPAAAVQAEINETGIIEACSDAADGGRRDACTTSSPAAPRPTRRVHGLARACAQRVGKLHARFAAFRSRVRLSGSLLSLRDPARRSRFGPGHPANAVRAANPTDSSKVEAPQIISYSTKSDSSSASTTTNGLETRRLEAGATAGGTTATEWRSRLFSLPWWAVSAALHVLVIVLVGLISMSVAPPNDEDAVVVVSPLLQPAPAKVELERKRADLTALEAHNEAAPTDPRSKLQCDVTVSPEVLANAQLSDHFETINPDGPDLHSAFGNPDAHLFRTLAGDDSEAGGGGTGGEAFDALLGAGGAASKGSGGGFGGGVGTGIGTDFGSGSGCFGQRTGRGRELLVKRHGGSPATEAAVDRALAWLARHQESDGHWDIAKYAGGDTQSGGYATDECVAPLAVLAFLGAGHSPKAGKYRDTVKRGLDWILSRQQRDGSIQLNVGGIGRANFMVRGVGTAYCYSEALATLALAEAFGMSSDKQLGDAAQRGINFLVSIQENDGGWSHYACKSTSVVGWVVMALKSAKIANLNVPPLAFTNALRYLDHVTEKDRNGYYGKAGYGGPQQYFYSDGLTMTAVSMVCLQFMGRIHDTEHQAELLSSDLPAWKAHVDFNARPQNFYHWYYGTLGLFQTGGEKWDKWNDALQKTLLPNQRKDSDGGTPSGSVRDLDGSWDPVTTWDPSGGRVYTTAMGALCLEVYYRYLQVQKH